VDALVVPGHPVWLWHELTGAIVRIANLSASWISEAPDTYTFQLAAFPATHYPIPMSSRPSLPVLQKLHDLDRSLSEFHDQLSNILYGEEYMRRMADLQGADLLWLVDYLDEVRHRVALPRSPIKLA